MKFIPIIPITQSKIWDFQIFDHSIQIQINSGNSYSSCDALWYKIERMQHM